MICYCEVYPYPHRLGGGYCEASGVTTCPNCGAVLGDEQVHWRKVAPQTRHAPAEYDYQIDPPCSRCGAE